MTKVALGGLFFIAAIGASAYPQALNQQQTATVHIYRNGSRGNAIQVLVDGAEAFQLDEHRMTTFALPPGRHEVSARYAGQQPTIAIDAEPGAQYFLQLLMDVRHGMLRAMGDSSKAVAVTLTQEQGVLNPDQIRDEPLSQDEIDFLAFKISQAHPAGAPMQRAESSETPPAPQSAATIPAAAPAPVAAPAPAPAAAFMASQPLPVTSAQAYSVRYAGGSVAGHVGKELQLRIGARDIELGSAVIPSDSVTGIALSQDKHHRIGTGIAVSMVTLGAGVPIMFSKSTKDFIEITWNNAGQTGGAAFQADKNEYRGILAALEGVTGKTATLPTEK